MPAVSRHHAGEDEAGAVHQPFDIGINHDLPVFRIHLVCRFKPKGKPGIVKQYIYLAKLLRKGVHSPFDRFPVTDIQRDDMDITAAGELLLKPEERINPSGGKNKPVSGFCKDSAAGSTESG
jgi:hypothetical protein